MSLCYLELMTPSIHLRCTAHKVPCTHKKVTVGKAAAERCCATGRPEKKRISPCGDDFMGERESWQLKGKSGRGADCAPPEDRLSAPDEPRGVQASRARILAYGRQGQLK